MATNETLGQALDAEGHPELKDLCTDAVLALTKDECKKILESHEVGLSNDDRKSFNKLCKTRIKKGLSILPWTDLDLDVDEDIAW